VKKDDLDVKDVDPNGSAGRLAQILADMGYGGVGIISCWTAQTVRQVNALRSLTNLPPVPFINKGSTLTWRERNYGNLNERATLGPGEISEFTDQYGNTTYAPTSGAQTIRDIVRQANEYADSDKMECCDDVAILWVDNRDGVLKPGHYRVTVEQVIEYDRK